MTFEENPKEYEWQCAFCHEIYYGNPLSEKWDRVWQHNVCPECQIRVEKDGGYAVVKCGAYVIERLDRKVAELEKQLADLDGRMHNAEKAIVDPSWIAGYDKAAIIADEPKPEPQPDGERYWVIMPRRTQFDRHICYDTAFESYDDAVEVGMIWGKAHNRLGEAIIVKEVK